MQVAQQKVVTIDYTLTDEQGTVLDQSEQGRFAYLHGASNIVPGLERALEGKEPGDDVKVTVPPQEAYGERDESLVQVVPRDLFSGAEPEVGMQFQAENTDGQRLLVTVAEVQGDEVTVDANHPLAGANLNFDVKVVDVRDATEDELAHGHAH